MHDVMLYGYDVRVSMAAADAEWTDERRAQYLLRLDVARPLSVDRMVWRTALSSGSMFQDAGGYWNELDTLHQACADAGMDKSSGVLVALAVLELPECAPLPFWPGMPADIDPAWPVLGWDVADSGLISALSNCGYVTEREDVDATRLRFASRLNGHGLFGHVDDALTFRHVSDARVPEHAPFLVHQMRLVPW